MSLTLPPLAHRLFTQPPRGIGAFETRTLEVLVADLAGSRALHESMDVAHSAALITSFVRAGLEALEVGQGVLDTVEGDGLLALFPVAGGATRAAMELVDRLGQMGTDGGPPRRFPRSRSELGGRNPGTKPWSRRPAGVV